MDLAEINLLAEQSACYRCLDERDSRTLQLYLDLVRANDNVPPDPPEPEPPAASEELLLEGDPLMIGGETITITPV